MSTSSKYKNIELMTPERIKARNHLLSKIDDNHILPNLNKLEGTGRLYSLADESPLKLGKDIYTKGTKTLDYLADILSGLFPDDGVGYHVNDVNMTELMALLGIESLLPQLQPLFDQLIDVRTFLKAICANLKLNPLYVLFAAEYFDLSSQNKSLFCQSINADENNGYEIRRAIIYCALLNSIATTWTFETQPTDEQGYFFCDIFTQLINDKVYGSVWASYSNAFDRAKDNSIDINYLIKMKHDYNDNDIYSPKNNSLLQSNILEAIYQDTLFENDDNAKAGFELLCPLYNQPKVVSLQQDNAQPWFYNNVPMGLRVYNYAFPRIWSNLYSSWNACFCSQFPESPYYFAALFAPCVSGFYQDIEKGIYIDYRVLCYWIHLQFIKLSRSDCRNRNFSQVSWLSDLATVMWSAINKKAAQRYEQLIGTTLSKYEAQYKYLGYDLIRPQNKTFFGNLTAYTMANRKITHSPEKIAETLKHLHDMHDTHLEKLQRKFNNGKEGDEHIMNKPIDPIKEGEACCIIN